MVSWLFEFSSVMEGLANFPVKGQTVCAIGTQVQATYGLITYCSSFFIFLQSLSKETILSLQAV